jgi:hypothetical protein
MSQDRTNVHARPEPAPAGSYGVTSDPDHVGCPTCSSETDEKKSAPVTPSALTREPDRRPASANRLEDVLPQIKDLALRVGGLQQLADIVESLKRGHA